MKFIYSKRYAMICFHTENILFEFKLIHTWNISPSFYYNRPVDKSSLLKIEDFPQVKVDRHGDVFVKLIKLFCDQNSLEVNKFPVFNSDVSILYVCNKYEKVKFMIITHPP